MAFSRCIFWHGVMRVREENSTLEFGGLLLLYVLFDGVSFIFFFFFGSVFLASILFEERKWVNRGFDKKNS